MTADACESDDDFDDSADVESDETEVVSCPACGADVYEDAEQCPDCGEWIENSTHPLAGRAFWFVGLGLLGIVVTIATLLVLAGF
ncbi:MAG: hypothetical protein M3552_04605 [Planctomycetota bacterium]|nr:hypothetical protein [Planctomycetaceae bacterium]MDQ3329920.1 hypothetical protein [Planctomycetota bacterium]